MSKDAETDTRKSQHFARSATPRRHARH
jgi:hypothetical protein